MAHVKYRKRTIKRNRSIEHETTFCVQGVAAWWREQPFDLALPNRDGVTPLGNCDLCFLKAEATIRGTIRDRPELAAWWIAREAEARPAKPSGARFRADRESYAVMRSNAERQGDLIEYLNQEGSLDCACTD